MTRRGLIAGTGAIALMGTSLSACSQSADYEALAREVWTLPEQTASPDLQWYARHAILAANSHNTQPWKISGTGSRVIISPDLSRATPVVDPDNHHLFTSLGCAAENVVISAGAVGKSAAVSFNSERDGSIEIDIAGQTRPQTALYAAIPERQCTRSDYAGAPVSRDKLDQLYSAARVEGVDVLFLIDKSGMDPCCPSSPKLPPNRQTTRTS